MRWCTKVAFASAHFLNVMSWAMWFPYNVTFFTKVLELPPKTTGNIILTVQVFGAISQPFMGTWSDQTQLKFGRRKIFQLMGMVAIAVSFFFLWHECIGCSNAPSDYQAVYFASFGIVFVGGWAAITISQLSLIPELAPDRHSVVQLNALRNTFTYLASILVFSFFWALLEQINHMGSTNSLTPSDTEIFWIMAIVVIILGFLVGIPFQIFVHEDHSIKLPSQRWYKWLQKPEFYLTAGLFATSRMVYLIPQTYMPLYFIDTLEMDRSSIAKGPLILLVTSFITTFAIKWVNKALGEKMTFFLGCATVWGALVWFWVKDPTDDHFSDFNVSRDSIYGAIVLLGVGGATTLAIAMAMFSFLIGKFTGSSAFVVGWMAFADLFFNGITVKIIQEVTPSPSRLSGFYRNVMVFTPFAATGVALLIIFVFLLLEWWQKCRKREDDAEESRGQTAHTAADGQHNSILLSDTVEFPKSPHLPLPRTE